MNDEVTQEVPMVEGESPAIKILSDGPVPTEAPVEAAPEGSGETV